ncbi:TlpA disulfide reductase family protein [Acidiferrobacter thiooxydans]|jgi:thiol-disulfide isomerase/thioredoxin|uniref:TlpA family protein disulfide reductase n=1 Tax=Acidiferrobacter thiooxydans TaxID=163359 RepID=A0A1C2G3Q9_9GAMM|nr:TlpA disulfide reductase family protein [Acidiferrobacter thiooxydans]MDA8119093.1 TlpA disulfide reductase family protein [Gammaproteobacteria bacterium]MDA8189972.1 TlpA disulfide reductase family protein [Gammaproteobacteria bacterium]RCN58312.1 TlpA family protein disulfide reductase [Acidiferrobacter thiooxydans]UEN99904.1 TlpA family protein disulfide reductase [Acidiferrobacter thiooxydans]
MKGRSHAVWAAAVIGALAAGFAVGRYAAPHAHAHARHSMRVHFTLPDLAGKPRTLDHWPAKVYLVNFWAPWCPPCRAEIPLLIRTAQADKARGLVVVGIALDRKAKVARFVHAHHIPYPVLLGGERGLEMLARLGDMQGAIPFSLLVTPHGRILTGQLGAFTRGTLKAAVATAFKRR